MCQPLGIDLFDQRIEDDKLTWYKLGVYGYLELNLIEPHTQILKLNSENSFQIK